MLQGKGKWEHNNDMNLKEIRLESRDSIHLVQGKDIR